MVDSLLDHLEDSMKVFISDLRMPAYLRDKAMRQLKALAHPSDYSLLE